MLTSIDKVVNLATCADDNDGFGLVQIILP